MIERRLEQGLFASRWLMAPFYVGLVITLALLMVKFVQELLHVIPNVLDLKETDVILAMLSLVDLTLAGNLLLIIVFAGYESTVSRINSVPAEDRPAWMGSVDFSGMKLKLIASMVAISGIHLLRTFMNVSAVDKTDVAWQVAIHMAFVVSGVFLALMDFLSARSKR